MLTDTLVDDFSEETRTHKIFSSLEEACRRLDLQVPIWLDSNIGDFKRSSKTRFYADSFIETIPFDCLEMWVIEED